MRYLLKNRPLLNRLVNKQFEMIGHPEVKIQDIEEGIKTKDGKKEKVIEWWKVYFFETEEQYKAWKDWVRLELCRLPGNEAEVGIEKDVNFIDLTFGMTVRLKKQGQLL